MKEIKTVIYEAEDGEQFTSEVDCLLHEQDFKSKIETFSKIKFYDEKCNLLNFPAEILTKCYFNDMYDFNENLYELVTIIRIINVTDEELETINDLFQMINELGYYVPENIKNNDAFYYDNYNETWERVIDIISKLKNQIKDYTEILNFPSDKSP